MSPTYRSTVYPLLKQGLPSALVLDLVSRNSWPPTGRVFLYLCICQDKFCRYLTGRLPFEWLCSDYSKVRDIRAVNCLPYFSPELVVLTCKVASSMTVYVQRLVCWDSLNFGQPSWFPVLCSNKVDAYHDLLGSFIANFYQSDALPTACIQFSSQRQ